MENTITITLEEYKELLQIKGKYEELKRVSYNPIVLNELPLPNRIECKL